MKTRPWTILVILFLGAVNTFAEPITYIWWTKADVTFASKTSNSVPVTIAQYADTRNVQILENGARQVVATTVVKVDGLGYAQLQSDSSIYANSGVVNLNGVFGLLSSVYYPNYDLKSNLPRYSFSGGANVATTSSWSTETTQGLVSMGPISELSFQAILGAHTAPSLTKPIDSFTLVEGDTVTLAATIEGTPPFSLQWRKDEMAIPNAATTNLTLTNLRVADTGHYDVVIQNHFGSITSNVAIATVNRSAPIITIQPRSQGAVLGSTIKFEAGAIGSPDLAWQWYFGSEPIDGATSNRLERAKVDITMLGSYWAIVANSFGSATTAVANLDRSAVIAWGLPTDFLPFNSENIISLTGGDYHLLALRSNGEVESWLTAGGPGAGGDDRGQSIVPPGLNDIVSIAAGSTHSLGVRRNGDLALWGETLSHVSEIDPAARNDVVMVAKGTGAQHVLALKSDGTIVDFGGNATHLAPLKLIPPEATNIVSVAAGAFHALALRADGRVLAWGNSDKGQTFINAAATGIVAIAAGWHTSMALRADGRIFVSGEANSPYTPRDNVDIAAGASHTMALRRTGQVLSQGSGAYDLNRVPATATNAAGVAAGSYTAFALLGAGPPKFNTVEADRFVAPGQNAYFRMWAIGAQPIHYQWMGNGIPIGNATNSSLVVTNVQADQIGLYTVFAANALGSATSKAMGLNVRTAPVINIEKIERTEAHIQIYFSAQTQRLYRLEFKTNLTETEWQFLKEIDPEVSSVSDVDIPPTTTQRFYRIRRR